jgi:hypothetical protein
VTLALIALSVAWLGGTAATYLFDDDAPLPARLAVGAPLGLAAWGLAGFVAACLFGLGPAAILIGLLAVATPVLVFRDAGRRRRLAGDARGSLALARPGARAAIFFYMAAAAALVWQVTGRAVLFEDGGIGTGVDHNLGDLPFHIAIVSGFVHGENLPPEHPELAGVRLTYPFLIDFVAAMLMRAGASLRTAFFVEGMVLGLCLVVILHRWSLQLTGDALAAIVAPVLFLLNGGMGWTMIFREAHPEQGGLMGLLGRLSHNYTILPTELRWGNVVTTLLVPQRTLLLGLPLALAAATLWWKVLREDPGGAEDEALARRRMAGAGVIAGLLPLVHGHSFAVVMAAGACLALLFPRRTWAWFFAPAAALSLPQVLWMAAGSSLRGRSFIGWHLGWDHGHDGVVGFWLRNTGLFIPLLLVAFLWRSKGKRLVPGRLARFYVPFALCFVLPNLLQLSPWIWDNIKFLVYWHVASVPIVGLLLAELWRRRKWRAAAVVGLALLTMAGALDVWRVVSRAERYVIFDADAVDFADRMREATAPRALVLHVPTYRSPVFLAGRRSLLGYPGHIWSQGLDAGNREADIARIYRGGANAAELLRRHAVDYVMYGPEEQDVAVGDSLLAYPEIVATERYRLYDVRGR